MNLRAKRSCSSRSRRLNIEITGTSKDFYRSLIATLFFALTGNPPLFNDDVFIEYNLFTLRHPEFGQLKFLSSSLPAITWFGDLHLNSFQALDAHTSQVCLQLARKLGTRPLHIAPWSKPSPNGVLMGDEDEII